MTPINVTQADIDQRGESPTNCPIALAIKRTPILGRLWSEVAVFVGSIQLGHRDGAGKFVAEHRYNMDIVTLDWMLSFHEGKQTYPYSFHLDTSMDYIGTSRQ